MIFQFCFAWVSTVEAAEVSLAWDAPLTNSDGSTLGDLTGYKVYIGTALDTYTTGIDVGVATQYTVLNLALNTTYYFAVTSYDRNSNESAFSNQKSYRFVVSTPSASDTDGDGLANSIDPDDDNDGLSDLIEISLGTNYLLADTDNDGVSDSDEVAQNSNPLDGGDVRSTLGKTICAEWNGFLGGMWNILEHTNLSTKTLSVETTLYSLGGSPVSSYAFKIKPKMEFDLPVHDLTGWTKNLYGKVCSHHNGAPGDIDGRMVYYKPENGGDGISSFQFAFALPFSNGRRGVQFVPFNTYHPGNNANLAANWIQITNQSPESAKGKLRFYDQLGSLIAERKVTVPAGARVDQSAHQFGKSRVGLVEWSPDNNVTNFIVRNVRYLYDNPGESDSFNSAFQLEAAVGSGVLLGLPLNTVARTSIVELVNTSSQKITALLHIYGGIAGDKTVNVSLKAKATFHVIINPILGDGQVGLVTAQGPMNSLLAIGMHYGFSNQTAQLDYMYGVPAIPSRGASFTATYNTFLEHDCWLILSNTSTQSEHVTLSGFASPLEVNLKARSSNSIYLNNYANANTYGLIELKPKVPDTILAWLFRTKRGSYVMPTTAR